MDSLDQEWKQGTSLPQNLYNHRMVSFDDNKETYVIGGYLSESEDSDKMDKMDKMDKIFKLICKDSRPENCKFEEQSVKLKYARHSHIAIPIPNSLVFELCQLLD